MKHNRHINIQRPFPKGNTDMVDHSHDPAASASPMPCWTPTVSHVQAWSDLDTAEATTLHRCPFLQDSRRQHSAPCKHTLLLINRTGRQGAVQALRRIQSRNKCTNGLPPQSQQLFDAVTRRSHPPHLNATNQHDKGLHMGTSAPCSPMRLHHIHSSCVHSKPAAALPCCVTSSLKGAPGTLCTCYPSQKKQTLIPHTDKTQPAAMAETAGWSAQGLRTALLAQTSCTASLAHTLCRRAHDPCAPSPSWALLTRTCVQPPAGTRAVGRGVLPAGSWTGCLAPPSAGLPPASLHHRGSSGHRWTSAHQQAAAHM